MSCYYNIPILIFAIVSFVSIAGGNIALSIATLVFFVYVYRKRTNISMNYFQYKKYYICLILFIFCMLLSALGSGDIARGITTWSNLLIWRMMPFFIITLSMNEWHIAEKILKFSMTGIAIGIICLIYQGISGDGRAAGFFGHPMTYAGYLCMYLPIFLIYFLKQQNINKCSLLTGSIFFLGCSALIFNGTRGAWIAVIPVLLIIFAYYFRQHKRSILCCFIVFFLIGMGFGQQPYFSDRLKSITSTSYQSNTERLLIWQSAYNMFHDYPILGVGLGQYKDSYQQKYISPQAKEPYLTHAHNNFLQMLAENGLIGFLGFLGMYGSIITFSLKKFFQEHNPYSFMICTSVIALMLQGLTEYNFGNSAVMKVFWLVQGCLIVMENKWRLG